MNILVLGATGFVGSYIMDESLAARHSAVGTMFNPTIDNADFKPFVKYLDRCDIRYGEQVDAVIAKSRPDVVYLLSAQSFPALSWAAPEETLDTNVKGTAVVFESIKRSGLDPVVIVACSSAQYGEVAAEYIPVREDHPMNPLHPYGVSKVATEMLARQYFTNFGIKAVCARIFNTTGPRKTGDVCADLTERVVRIEAGLTPPELTVGNQETWRAITDVRDLTSALRLLAEKGEHGEAYNISGARTYQIRELVEMVRQLSSADFAVVQDPKLMRPSDEKVIFGDSTKLKDRTGWSQTVPIEQTVSEMLDYWRGKYGVAISGASK